jgi:hypothetical protein
MGVLLDEALPIEPAFSAEVSDLAGTKVVLGGKFCFTKNVGSSVADDMGRTWVISPTQISRTRNTKNSRYLTYQAETS